MIVSPLSPARLVYYNVTIPDTISETCPEAGDRLIQWYWYASGNEQTYQSCHDFALGGL